MALPQRTIGEKETNVLLQSRNKPNFDEEEESEFKNNNK